MGKKERVNKAVYNALENIREQPKEMLCEIYWVLNGWGWHEKLGKKPDGYDKLPPCNHCFMDKFLKRETKHDYIEPIMAWIAFLVPLKARYRYANLIKENDMTDQEFEDWYDSVKDDLKCFEPRI